MSEPAPVTESEIQAYADGVLGEERRSAVEAWLAARPQDVESIAVYRRFRDLLRAAYEPVLADPIPPRLRPAVREECAYGQVEK